MAGCMTRRMTSVWHAVGLRQVQEAKQCHPATARRFEWDAANEGKLAERGIKPHEVEGVWSNKPDYRRNKKAGSALWMMTVLTRSQGRS